MIPHSTLDSSRVILSEESRFGFFTKAEYIKHTYSKNKIFSVTRNNHVPLLFYDQNENNVIEVKKTERERELKVSKVFHFVNRSAALKSQLISKSNYMNWYEKKSLAKSQWDNQNICLLKPPIENSSGGEKIIATMLQRGDLNESHKGLISTNLLHCQFDNELVCCKKVNKDGLGKYLISYRSSCNNFDKGVVLENQMKACETFTQKVCLSDDKNVYKGVAEVQDLNLYVGAKEVLLNLPKPIMDRQIYELINDPDFKIQPEGIKWCQNMERNVYCKYNSNKTGLEEYQFIQRHLCEKQNGVEINYEDYHAQTKYVCCKETVDSSGYLDTLFSREEKYKCDQKKNTSSLALNHCNEESWFYVVMS